MVKEFVSLQNNIRLPKEAVVTKTTESLKETFTVEFISTEKQPNGLPKYGCGVTNRNQHTAEEEIVETIKKQGYGDSV